MLVSLVIDYDNGEESRVPVMELRAVPNGTLPPVWQAQQMAFDATADVLQYLSAAYYAHCLCCALVSAAGGGA
jgi:hypothetical protein